MEDRSHCNAEDVKAWKTGAKNIVTNAENPSTTTRQYLKGQEWTTITTISEDR